MNKWLYVVATVDSRNSEEMVDAHDMIGFDHIVVEAETVEDAYRVGFDTLVLLSTQKRVNDYVIPLGSPLAN